MATVGVGAVTAEAPSGAAVEVPPWVDAHVSRALVVMGLVIVLLISRLPEIIAREVLALDVPWIAWATAGMTVLLWLGARTLPVLRPFERFLAVMVLVTLLAAGLPVFLESELWTGLVPASTNEVVVLLATRVLYAVLAVAVLGWALFLGASRRELYLRVGQLNAPTRRGAKSGEPVRWTRFGPIAFVALMLLMLWFGAPMLPARLDVAAALPLIGIGAVAALLNAFWEEAAFRSAPLSMLQRAVGPGIGVLLLALWFGLGHYYGGVPSGPMGLIATGSVAVLLGRAMIETRGFAWPLALHFAIDFVIYTLIAFASVG